VGHGAVRLRRYRLLVAIGAPSGRRRGLIRLAERESAISLPHLLPLRLVDGQLRTCRQICATLSRG
jgi:hypothetical protein